jgi:hypothetical protein
MLDWLQHTHQKAAAQGLNGLTLGVLLFAISPLLLPGGFWNAYWLAPWKVLLVITVVGISVAIGKKIHWTVAPFFGWVLLSSLYPLISTQYNKFGNVARTGLQKEALYSALIFLAVGVCAIFWREYLARNLGKAFAWLCILATAFTLSQFRSIAWERAGFVGNASMNGCLIAYTMPFLMLLAPRIVVPACVFGILSIFLTGSSVAIGALAVAAMSYFCNPWAMLGGALAGATGYFLQGAAFLASSGRFDVWPELVQWYSLNNFNSILGAGNGTASVFMLSAHPRAGFIFAHNDYLQIFLDSGYVGLVTIFVMLAGVLWRVRKNKILRASIAAYAATAIFNYPSHVAVTAIVGVGLVLLAHSVPALRAPDQL